MTRAPAPPWIVIMGAAVRRGGGPSGALRRRVAAALDFARSLNTRAIFLPTGGIGTHPPAEAEVMARLLRDAGIAPQDIVLEDTAQDTLSSVEACVVILARRAPGSAVYVASDGFHQPRCRALFRIYGLATRGVPIQSSRHSGWRAWLFYCVREAVALPWDIALAVGRRALGWPRRQP